MKKEHPRPPFWALQLIERLCPKGLSEAIIGDLLEQFDDDLNRMNANKARMRFIKSSLRFLHPSILIKNKIKMKSQLTSITKSHFKVAYRSILKHKFYSSINILGLSFSIAFVFLSWLFIQTEYTYDSFHENGNDIYRTYTYEVSPETGEIIDGTLSGVTPVPLGPTLKEESPTVQYATRFGSSTGTVSIQNIPYEEVVCMADQDFLEMFSFPLIDGSKFKVLDDPNSMLLSPEFARKCFGDKEAIGQEIKLTMNDSTRTFFVAGIIDNKKDQSSIVFDILVPFETMGMITSERHMKTFGVSFVENYVVMRDPGPDTPEMFSEIVKQRTNGRFANLKVGIQPLNSIHFDTQIVGNALYTNPQKLWAMGALVILVLVIATINFVALTTGHSFNRVKEIGLRKTLGSFRSSLGFQLIVESFVFTLIAGVLGMALAWLLLPAFNQLIEASIPSAFSLQNIGVIIILALIPGIICGLSQATLLVKMKPIQALQGINILSSKESWFNQGLIILQFTISILLIIGTIAIRSQMNYIQRRDLGFSKDRLVEISTQSPENLQEAKLLHDRFRSQALANPAILQVGASMNSFQEPWTELAFAQVEGEPEKLYFNLVDDQYLEAMELELVEGETFKPGDGSATSILVNEELVRHFEWENPLKEQLPGTRFNQPHRIVGVIKDFHFSSLHQKIEPLVLAVNPSTVTQGATGLSTYVWPPNLYRLIVRIGPGDLQGSMAFLEATWKEVNGLKPFSFQFIDDSIAQSYAEEQRWQQLIDVASLFAILIAWMGLLGLMRISVQKRMKEIGIRKVLGSSIFDVVFSLSRRFLVLVAVSILIAWPIAWWGVNEWLTSFSYRFDMNFLVLLIGGLTVLLVAMFSVGLQAKRAASANPVECLRSE